MADSTGRISCSSQEPSCIRLTLNSMVNEFVDGVCALLPGTTMFPAGRSKAEDIRRGKMAKNINDQFN